MWNFPQSFSCNVSVGTEVFQPHSLPTKGFGITSSHFGDIIYCFVAKLLAENGENLINATSPKPLLSRAPYVKNKALIFNHY